MPSPAAPRASRPVLAAAASTLVADLLGGAEVDAVVLGVHPPALYLDVAGAVLPVVTSDAAALPTALRLAVPAGALDWGVAPGDAVPVGRGRVTLPSVDIAVARTWTPARVRRVVRPGPGEHEAVRRLLDATAVAGCDPWLLEALRAHVVSGALDALGHRSAEVVQGLLGRGRGLTPSGDDALAGVLLVSHAHGIRPGLGVAVRGALHRTTAVSAALLGPAADGFAARDVVTLVDAAVAGDVDAVARAAPAVCALGHSSGRDLVAGVGAALGTVKDSPA